MDIFTVSLFGHRQSDHLWALEAQLKASVRRLIESKSCIVFLIGRNGEFDEYAASVIKQAKREIENENADLTLVLPYRVSNIEYYEKYYDNVVIPDSVHNAHPKSAILLRNQWMIDRSDLVMVYVERNVGGAYQAMKYAERTGKSIVILGNKKTADS